MAFGRTARDERLERIQRMIDTFRAAKRRQILRRAMKLLRQAENRRRLVMREEPPERVH